MNKKVLTVFILMLISAPAFAAEPVVEVVPAAAASKDAAGSFIVTGSGKLIPQAGPVFTQGGHYEGVQLPYLASTPKPIEYPRWALRQGWEGRVSIAIEVLKNGTVGRTKVMQSSGHKILDESAVSAVKTWKFRPAMKNGQVIVECAQIPVIFKLNEE